MGIKLDLLPPAKYESGLLNYVAQNFTRIQNAFAKVQGGAASADSPSDDPTPGDTWVDTTTKSYRVWDGTQWAIISSYVHQTFSPVITQGVTVSRTVDSCVYQYQGDYVVGEWFCTMTGSGTASNLISVTGPVGIASQAGQAIGYGRLIRSGGIDPLTAVVGGGTSIRFTDQAQAYTNFFGAAGSSRTAALASGDALVFSFRYRWQ